jgi:hypothetical protein
MKTTPKLAKLFISLMALMGAGTIGIAAAHWGPHDQMRFVSFLVVTAIAATLKVSLPRINGSMSVNLPFILIALMELSFSEAVVIACVSSLVQCLVKTRKRPQPLQVVFNLGTMSSAVGLAAYVFGHAQPGATIAVRTLYLACATAAFLLANTLPVAMIVSLTENKSAAATWKNIVTLTFPYYVVSAGVASMTSTISQFAAWHTPLFVMVVMGLIYHSYRTYFATMHAAVLQQKLQVAAVASMSGAVAGE